MAIGLDEIDPKVRDHVEKHVGKIESVFHQPMMTALAIGGVPLEVLHVGPSKKFPFHTLVTTGMSQNPLPAPKEMKELSRVELVLCLPRTWQPPTVPGFSDKADAANWPIHQLLTLAQACHVDGRLLLPGMLIPNGDGPGKIRPIFKGVPFYGSVVWLAGQFGDEFVALSINRRTNVVFLSIVCLLKKEMEALLPLEFEAMMEKLNGVDLELIADPKRKASFA